MTYGLISDIHANLEALEAVLGELSGVDAFLCLGDIVGYGPDPGPCVERVRQLPGLVCVAGNHDLVAVGRYDLNEFNPYAGEAIHWTRQQLSEEQESYLSSLPLTVEAAGAILVHGSLPEEMAYVTTAWDALQCFEAFGGPLCLIGHTHVAECYVLRSATRFPEQISLRSGGVFALDPELRYIVNPGAVGQPRDGNPAAGFGIYDTGVGTIEIRRVSYDIESVQRKMRAAGLPAYLSKRLSVGR
jgi:diadenosine tetraphosphatase ApaH/serine/threonine PP2A family protein phosphatase